MSVCPATFIRVITFALSTLFGVNIAGAQDFVFGSPNASPITVRPPIMHETAKNSPLIEKGMTDKMVKALIGGLPVSTSYDDEEETLYHADYHVIYHVCEFTATITGEGSNESFPVKEIRRGTATIYYMWNGEKSVWQVYKVTGPIEDVAKFLKNGRRPITTMTPKGERIGSGGLVFGPGFGRSAN